MSRLAMLRAALHGQLDPLSAIPQLAAALDPHVRVRLQDVLELLAAAPPPPPPRWLAPVLEEAGAEHGLSPELLAAVAGELSDFNPGVATPHRVGLMGIPHAALRDGPAYAADLEAVQAGAIDALEAVRTNVHQGARVISHLRGNLGGLTPGLRHYLERGGVDPAAALPPIVAGYALRIGGMAPPDRVASLLEVFRGG